MMTVEKLDEADAFHVMQYGKSESINKSINHFYEKKKDWKPKM